MAADPSADSGDAGWAGALLAPAADALGGHHWLSDPALTRGPDAARNAADLIHHLALAHGRYPGLAETALLHTRDAGARALLGEIGTAFATERALVALLAAKVGPLPSTPGHAACETAVAGHAAAIDLLGRSDREGCALGATMALACDWDPVRRVVAAVADRHAVAIPDTALPSPDVLAGRVAALGLPPQVLRAFCFGVDQLRAQHDGLWVLLAARAAARASLD